MATAHGAGLMVVPVFVGMSMAGGRMDHLPAAAGTNAGAALLAIGLHAVSYLAVSAFIALLVFEKLGVGILRRAWFNLDLIWAGALVATGLMTIIIRTSSCFRDQPEASATDHFLQVLGVTSAVDCLPLEPRDRSHEDRPTSVGAADAPRFSFDRRCFVVPGIGTIHGF